MNNMKSAILSILLFLIAAAPCHAQSETADTTAVTEEDLYVEIVEKEPSCQRNFFVELFGPSLSVAGIGFDSRFRPGSPFGYRVGLAYTDGSYEDDWRCLDFNGVNIPVELNAIFGRRKSKFELGIGFVASVLNRTLQTSYYEIKTTDDPSTIPSNTFYGTTSDGDAYYWNIVTQKDRQGTRVNISGLMNIGYRYQRDSGFFMRVGLTFMLGNLRCSPFDGLMLMPNVAFGYTIR